ncbi:hypothetical protein HRbin27_01192 [bacterium HR27]|nr:hypothetical protein HRbin27_01192 [bacterium HR27]
MELDAHVLDQLLMAGIQSLGDAQNGSELFHKTAEMMGQTLELWMAERGLGRPMIPSDIGDEELFSAVESFEGDSHDAIETVAVMLGKRPKLSAVVPEGGRGQVVACLRGKAKAIAELIEESQCEEGDVLAVFWIRCFDRTCGPCAFQGRVGSRHSRTSLTNGSMPEGWMQLRGDRPRDE